MIQRGDFRVELLFGGGTVVSFRALTVWELVLVALADGSVPSKTGL